MSQYLSDDELAYAAERIRPEWPLNYDLMACELREWRAAGRAVFGLDERGLASEWFEQDKIRALRRLVEATR